MHHQKVGSCHIVRKTLHIDEVDYDFNLRKTCSVETDHALEDLKMVHLHQNEVVIPKKRASVDMAFFLSTSFTEMKEIWENVPKAGVRPASIPEVDSLRLFKRSKEPEQLGWLYKLADAHDLARNRKGYVDTLCLPILATHFQVKGEEDHFAVMMICRTCGADKIQIVHRREMEKIHPAMIVPLVVQVAQVA